MGRAVFRQEEKLPDGPIKLKIGDVKVLSFPQVFLPCELSSCIQ